MCCVYMCILFIMYYVTDRCTFATLIKIIKCFVVSWPIMNLYTLYKASSHQQ